MPQSTCPDGQTIQQFLLGKLSQADASQLEEHLEHYADCAETAHGLAAEDTLVAAMRSTETLDDPLDQTTVAEIVARVRGLRNQHVSAHDETVNGGSTTGDTQADRELADFLAPPQSADELGRLDGYRVLSVLGCGGMGVVFLAEDVQLKRLVALKAMQPALAASPSNRERFLREARAIAATEHDHIVTIYHVGEECGIPFFAMQLLEGESLESRLTREGTLPSADALRICRQTAAGLAAAHQRGLLHRDIKPDNIFLVSRAGDEKSPASQHTPQVKLLDFGLVRDANDDTRLTRTGYFVGTPKYMAPEQVREAAVDHRSDLFSLGSVLYRMLTGEAPFAGSTIVELLTAISDRDPTPPVTLNPELPADVNALILRLLEKNPDRRFQSAVELITAIEVVERRLAAEEQQIAETIPEPSRDQTRLAPSNVRTRPRNVLLIAAALFAVLMSGVVLLRTAKGTVEVTSAAGTLPADVQVTVLTEDGETAVVIESKDQWRASLRGGQYVVRLHGPSADAFELKDQTLSVRRFNKSLITITRKAANADKPADNDRTIAQWLHSRGENVGVRIGDEYPKTVGPLDTLPAEEFNLVHVNFLQTQLASEDLGRLSVLPHLESFHAEGPTISDDELAQIVKFATLQVLILHKTKLTDDGLVHLSGLAGLDHLSLYASETLTDDGLRHIQPLKHLRILNLATTGVSDEGMRHLAQMTKLEELHVSNVTDRFTDFLPLWPQLRHLRLDQAALTDEGLHKLAAASQLGSLEMLYCDNVSNDGLQHLSSLPSLESCNIASPVVTDEGLIHLGRVKQLKKLMLRYSHVTEDGLLHLQNLTSLELLLLTPADGESNISAAGVARLQVLLPNCEIRVTE